MLIIFFIALSLSLDSFSVAMALGLNYKKNILVNALKIGLFFGLFQGIMLIIGWIIGNGFKHLISGFDHWIAFLILSLIGVRIMFSKNETYKEKDLNLFKIIFLSVATSIDALMVGVSFSFLKLPLFLSSIVIGITTFVLSVIGFYFGSRVHLRIKNIKILAGLILIFIGLKILIEHLI